MTREIDLPDGWWILVLGDTYVLHSPDNETVGGYASLEDAKRAVDIKLQQPPKTEFTN